VRTAIIGATSALPAISRHECIESIGLPMSKVAMPTRAALIGPIVEPQSRNLIVTPIAGYLSAIRSVVAGPTQTVRCRIVDAHEALVSIDGREDIPLAVGDMVAVRAVDRPIRLVEPQGTVPFWDLLRHKVELLPS